MIWKVSYSTEENESGYRDVDTVTNVESGGDKVFKCYSTEEAKWLCKVLNNFDVSTREFDWENRVCRSPSEVLQKAFTAYKKLYVLCNGLEVKNVFWCNTGENGHLEFCEDDVGFIRKIISGKVEVRIC